MTYNFKKGVREREREVIGWRGVVKGMDKRGAKERKGEGGKGREAEGLKRGRLEVKEEEGLQEQTFHIEILSKLRN